MTLDLEPSERPLAEGRYTRSGFQPRVEFDVSDGQWTAVQAFDARNEVSQSARR